MSAVILWRSILHHALAREYAYLTLNANQFGASAWQTVMFHAGSACFQHHAFDQHAQLNTLIEQILSDVALQGLDLGPWGLSGVLPVMYCHKRAHHQSVRFDLQALSAHQRLQLASQDTPDWNALVEA